MIDEGELDGSFRFWAEDEVDGAEGCLDAREGIFYVYDEQNESWFQHRFQGRRSRKDKGKGRSEKAVGEAVAEEDSSNLAERTKPLPGGPQSV